jgi:hypothetical protein
VQRHQVARYLYYGKSILSIKAFATLTRDACYATATSGFEDPQSLCRPRYACHQEPGAPDLARAGGGADFDYTCSMLPPVEVHGKLAPDPKGATRRGR